MVLPWVWGGSGRGGRDRGDSVEARKLKTKKHDNTLTWLQNVGSAISEDLSFSKFPWQDDPAPIQGTAYGGLYLHPPPLQYNNNNSNSSLLTLP